MIFLKNGLLKCRKLHFILCKNFSLISNRISLIVVLVHHQRKRFFLDLSASNSFVFTQTFSGKSIFGYLESGKHQTTWLC